MSCIPQQRNKALHASRQIPHERPIMQDIEGMVLLSNANRKQEEEVWGAKNRVAEH